LASLPRPGRQVSEDEIDELRRGQIAHYKIPRYVRVVADLPMTVTGKPQKFIMRDKMIAELGLAETETA
jgi:fatty-acyl-CoA synthase